MLTKCAFLTGDQVYELDVPQGLVPGAWTHVRFVPRDEQRPSAANQMRPLGSKVGANDVLVTVFADEIDPGARVVEWNLARGAIVTSFNPGHEDDLWRYVEGIAVSDGELPRLVLGYQIGLGDSRERIQRDLIAFDRDYGTSGEQVLSMSSRRHGVAPKRHPRCRTGGTREPRRRRTA